MRKNSSPCISPPLLISACLCGVACRYDAKSFHVARLLHLYESGKAIIVCPELCANLSIPRVPCEIMDGRVLSVCGRNFSAAFMTGAERALDLALRNGVKTAILKDKSPSCGSTVIYDGTFSGRLIPGQGVMAALFAQNGIRVFNENNFYEFLQ